MPQPVIRARSIDDLVHTVPHLLGFHPTDSIVVGCLAGSPPRVGMVMRRDIPRRADVAREAAEVAAMAARHQARAVFVLVFAEQARTPVGVPRPRRGVDTALAPLVCQDFADRLALELSRRRIGVLQSALVSGGRRWSLLGSDDPRPAEGVPVADVPSAEVGLLAAEQAFGGSTPLPDRRALAASVRPPDAVPGAPAARTSSEGSPRRSGAPGVGTGVVRRLPGARPPVPLPPGERAALVEKCCALVRTAAARLGEPSDAMTGEAVAFVLAAMRDLWVRDAVLTLALEASHGDEVPSRPVAGQEFDSAALLSVLTGLAQSAGDADAAPVCAVLAGTAYAFGHGGLANVALERAVECEPDYALAGLLDQMLTAQCSPVRMRDVLRAVSEDLHAALAEVSPPGHSGRADPLA